MAVEHDTTLNVIFTGVAVSPNSRFAYLSSHTDLWQVDLEADDMQQSLTLIDTFDGFGDPFATNFHLAQLGPDCKIYICSTNGTRFLHVIHNPDEKGKLCNFRQHDLELPHYNNPGSLPNFPHFRMDEEDVCDNTITSIFGIPFISESRVHLYPNPASDFITLENRDYHDYTITDVTGARVSHGTWDKGEARKQIDVTTFHDGIYIISARRRDGKRVVSKFVVSR